LFELRKEKGLSLEMAASQLEDNVVLGTMMLAQGEVDGLVSARDSLDRQHDPASVANHQDPGERQNGVIDFLHVFTGAGPGVWRLRRDSGS
jgi:phosphotransacetylase